MIFMKTINEWYEDLKLQLGMPIIDEDLKIIGELITKAKKYDDSCEACCEPKISK